MKAVVAWAKGLALSFGGPGLFFVAFLDASFLSLPEINDILVVWMVTRQNELFAYYAAMATLGSVAGCLVLYGLAWKGGEAFMQKRLKSASAERGLTAVRRYGFLALLVPAMLPPPAPFKIFVLGAGVARVRPLTFVLAVGLGRGLRYYVAALLALWYGEASLQYIEQHGKEVALIAAALVLVSGVAVVWWQRRRPAGAASST
jgi:membrane protein YqaA with SNARE-associated domain